MKDSKALINYSSNKINNISSTMFNKITDQYHKSTIKSNGMFIINRPCGNLAGLGPYGLTSCCVMTLSNWRVLA